MRTFVTAAAAAATLAVFLAVGLGSHPANAGDQTRWDNVYDTGGACNKWARISRSSATCLTGGQNNTYDAGEAGYKVWAKNECSSIGSIVVHHDRKVIADNHFHLGGGNTFTTYSSGQTRNIRCCIDKSDLCWKEQVRPYTSGDFEGYVKNVVVSSSSYETSRRDVSTHEARYAYCSDWPNSIYCEKNPKGDAFTLPASTYADSNDKTRDELRARPCGGGGGELACNCGDHVCDRFDCMDNFNASPARTATTGNRCVSDATGNHFAIDDDNWTCSTSHTDAAGLGMNCRSGNMVNLNGRWQTLTQRIHYEGAVDTVDDLEVCLNDDQDQLSLETSCD